MLVVVVLLPLSFWQWTMVSSTTVVAVPPPTAATAVAAAKAGGRLMVAASFDGGHTKISRRTTRGREGSATRGREGGTTFATTDIPLMLTPEAAMQLAVNTTNELSKTIVNMPNYFIGGGSKDTPHSEGECYVSKNASGLIVIITLRASQSFFNVEFKLFVASDALRSDSPAIPSIEHHGPAFKLIVIFVWTKISLIFREDCTIFCEGEWSPTTTKIHGDFIVPLPSISTTSATAKPNGLEQFCRSQWPCCPQWPYRSHRSSRSHRRHRRHRLRPRCLVSLSGLFGLSAYRPY
jgi:hypothetical protein